jgi:hypothetical protein
MAEEVIYFFKAGRRKRDKSTEGSIKRLEEQSLKIKIRNK